MDTEDLEIFLSLGKGAFDHIPGYARSAALEAIKKVRTLENQRLFRPGAYYICLTDLCHSTESSATLGIELNQKRIESFVIGAVSALARANPKNFAHFVKQTGDAALFIFSHFSDLFHWWKEADKQYQSLSLEWAEQLDEEDIEAFEITAKTVVHVGEVSYSDKSDPLALAVNQVFKIEKQFAQNELGATNRAKMIAAPLFKELGIVPREHGAIILPQEAEEAELWLLATSRV